MSSYYPLMPELTKAETACIPWTESLARSKAQIASGESVSLLPLLDRLRESAERMEAEQGVTADGERLSANY